MSGDFLTGIIGPGVADPDGQIAKEYTEKYLGTAQLGDFQSMVAGLTDVNIFKKNHLTF